MRRTTILALVVLSILGRVRAADRSTEAVVKDLFTAINANDTKTVLTNNYRLQRQVEKVRRDDPKFAQDAKIGQLYSASEREFNFVAQKSPFEQEFNNAYRDLRFLLSYKPSISVLEVKPSTAPEDEFGRRRGVALDVYVKLTFSSPWESPYDGLLGGANPIKEAVVLIRLCDGQFLGADRDSFRQYDVKWQDLPLHITFVMFYHYGGDRGDVRVSVACGGTPPKSGTLTLAGRKFELDGSNGEWKKNGIVLAGAPAVLEMRSATGQVSTVRFVVRGIVEGGSQNLASEVFIPGDVLANPWQKLYFPGTKLFPGSEFFEFQYDNVGSKGR